MDFIRIFNLVITSLFFVCYFYQIVYIFVSLFSKEKTLKPATKNHRFAILIAAHNEKMVIGHLIDSIRRQVYPADLIDIYVGADNCTDNTAEIARSKGAVVYERFDTEKKGKGYVLRMLFDKLKSDTDYQYDAFIVFDADNVLNKNFISEMNVMLNNGYELSTCYRNSKNYGTNWISAGYALWFLRESRYLNGVRMHFNTSCAVSGTGFMFTKRIIEKYGGWNFFLLTEDIEFTIANVICNEKIGYARKAVLYDEQPVTFAQSWRQRLRWAKGFLQVFRHYGIKLMKGMFKGDFSCYDMTMTIMPAATLTGISTVFNICMAIYCLVTQSHLDDLKAGVIVTIICLTGLLFISGIITTITEWKNINCKAWKKVLYAFTFPLFMLTYIPISLVAFFAKPEWKPIDHNDNVSIDDIEGDAAKEADEKTECEVK